jgi:hypothetical protein
MAPQPQPSLDAVFLCEVALLDPYTGRISLINLIDALSSTRVPALVPKFCVVTRWTGAASGNWFVDIILRAIGSGEIVARFTAPFKIAQDPHYVVSNLSGVRLNDFGSYDVEARLQVHGETPAALGPPVVRRFVLHPPKPADDTGGQQEVVKSA